KMLALLKKLVGLVESPAEFNRRIVEVDALRVKIKIHERAYRLVSSVTQHAELQRFAADRRLSLAEIDAPARARRQLERDIRFVEAILEGTGALTKILETCRDRFDAAIAEAAP